MRRLCLSVLAVLGVLFATVGMASASPRTAAAAVPVLTRVAPGGPPATPGDTLTSSLTPGTALSLTTTPGGSVGLFCKKSTWGGQLQSNPAAPGTAVIKLLNPFVISSCADNSPTVTGVAGVTVGNLPETLTVNDTGSFPLQIVPSPNPLTITVTLTTTGPTVVCVFQAATGVVNGNTGPGGAPWKFVNQPFRLLGGSLPACGTSSTSFLTAQYSPVVDATAGGSTIYVN